MDKTQIRSFRSGAGARLPKKSAALLDAWLADTEEAVEIIRLLGDDQSKSSFRTDVARLNQALAKHHAAFAFTVKTEKLLAEPSDAAEAYLEKRGERGAVDLPVVTPRAAPRKLEVMFCYGWLPKAQQDMQIDFCKRLKDALGALPREFRDLPPVTV